MLYKFIHKLRRPYRPKMFCPTEEDYYLVSYPRSGNTWMRVILSEILYGESGNNLADINYFIPDIHYSQFEENTIAADFHIVKSHLPYQENYKKVIYLIRDPRDVFLSHYRYRSARGYRHSLDDFLHDWLTGRIWPTSWGEHVNSWTGLGIEEHKIKLCLVRYEDLIIKPTDNIKKIVDFIGVNVSLDTINNAIRSSSVEQMKEKENHGLREGENVEGMVFIGEATFGYWKKKLNSQQINLIEKYFNQVMKRFGYLR